MSDQKNPLDALEAELLELLKGEFSSLTISFNEMCAPGFQKVGEYLTEDEPWGEDADWISVDDKRVAIETNKWWTLQWYANSPAAFDIVHASSLAGVINHIRKLEK